MKDRLANPPGDGVTVEHLDGRIRVELEGGVPRKWMLVGLLSIACLMPVLFCVLLLGSFSRQEYSEVFRWIYLCVFGIFCLLGLAMFGLFFFYLVTARMRPRWSFEIDSGGLRIFSSDEVLEVPWADIREVMLPIRRKPAYQIVARIGAPYVKGVGDGVLIKTEHGTFGVLSNWHDEVCAWVAGVLADQPKEVTREEMGSEKVPAAWMDKWTAPTRLDRFEVAKLAFALMFAGGMAALFAGHILFKFLEARQWQIGSAVAHPKFPWSPAWCLFLAFCVILAGFICLLYAIFGKQSELAERYVKLKPARKV